VFANPELLQAIRQLQAGQMLTKDGYVIAARMAAPLPGAGDYMAAIRNLQEQPFTGKAERLQHLWDIFSLNDMAIKSDYALLTKGRQSAPVPEGVTVTGRENLFIEEGAIINAGCIIN